MRDCQASQNTYFLASGVLRSRSSTILRCNIYNETSANPKSIDEKTRRHYAKLYARPGAMHAAFNQFAAFNQDAIDNKAFAAKGNLPIPVLALGGDHSFGMQQAEIMRLVASNVEGGVIANSGHWIMEEQPVATVKAVRDFLERK